MEEEKKKEKSFGWVAGIVSFIVVYLIISHFTSPNWSLFFYPDGCLSCQSKWIIEIDKYSSKESCRDAGDNLKSVSGNLGDTFECGYKCKAYDSAGYLCKKTLDF